MVIQIGTNTSWVIDTDILFVGNNNKKSCIGWFMSNLNIWSQAAWHLEIKPQVAHGPSPND